MDKTTIEQKSKLMIARDKFCDDNFDKLVIETSQSVARKGLGSFISPDLTGQDVNDPAISDSQDKINCDHNKLNQPKRPMNAFMVWGQAIRRELHHKFSNVQNALLSKALGRVWRSLDATEKEPFVRRANLIKANHKRDYPNYRYQPRRVQERRARSNMLIGINLNHPVNQLKNQQQTATYLSDETTTVVTNHQMAHSSFEYNGLLPADDHKMKLRVTNSRRSLIGEPVARDLSKDAINSVQTFEYHPYPAGEATIECNCRLNTGCQSDATYRGGQHQTYIYPPYQQSTYNMLQSQHYQPNQPQHYHQQHLPQQSCSYEVIQYHQSNLKNNCTSVPQTMDKTGLYYGNS